MHLEPERLIDSAGMPLATLVPEAVTYLLTQYDLTPETRDTFTALLEEDGSLIGDRAAMIALVHAITSSPRMSRVAPELRRGRS